MGENLSMQQFIRYIIVGIVSFILEYLIFLFLNKLLGIGYIVVSNTIAYTTVFTVNFLLNRLWSFKSKKDYRKQLLQYGLLFAFNMLISNFLIYILTNKLKIIPEYSKILVMGTIVMWNFFVYRKIIYND